MTKNRNFRRKSNVDIIFGPKLRFFSNFQPSIKVGRNEAQKFFFKLQF